MKGNTHIELNTISIWRIDFQLVHTLEGLMSFLLIMWRPRDPRASWLWPLGNSLQGSSSQKLPMGPRKVANGFLIIHVWILYFRDYQQPVYNHSSTPRLCASSHTTAYSVLYSAPQIYTFRDYVPTLLLTEVTQTEVVCIWEENNKHWCQTDLD